MILEIFSDLKDSTVAIQSFYTDFRNKLLFFFYFFLLSLIPTDLSSENKAKFILNIWTELSLSNL